MHEEHEAAKQNQKNAPILRRDVLVDPPERHYQRQRAVYDAQNLNWLGCWCVVLRVALGQCGSTQGSDNQRGDRHQRNFAGWQLEKGLLKKLPHADDEKNLAGHAQKPRARDGAIESNANRQNTRKPQPRRAGTGHSINRLEPAEQNTHRRQRINSFQQ
ncbi:MAG: hypothetical protein DME26_03095 [Verrucomicrobia bacterium]|nr:MAG: hypothetical protein DME26_03095 [Verrucomicrobiota bacterium]